METFFTYVGWLIYSWIIGISWGSIFGLFFGITYLGIKAILLWEVGWIIGIAVWSYRYIDEKESEPGKGLGGRYFYAFYPFILAFIWGGLFGFLTAAVISFFIYPDFFDKFYSIWWRLFVLGAVIYWIMSDKGIIGGDSGKIHNVDKNSDKLL